MDDGCHSRARLDSRRHCGEGGGDEGPGADARGRCAASAAPHRPDSLGLWPGPEDGPPGCPPDRRRLGAASAASRMTASRDPPMAGSFGHPRAQAALVEGPGALLRLLKAPRKNLLLYLPGHPQVALSLHEFHAGLGVILKSRGSVRFDIYEDAFFLGNRILLEESLQTPGLLEELMTNHVGSVEFLQGAPLQEATRFVQLLAAAAGGQSHLGDAVAGAGLQFIKTGPAKGLGKGEQKTTRPPPRGLYRNGLRTMDALDYQAIQGAPL